MGLEVNLDLPVSRCSSLDAVLSPTEQDQAVTNRQGVLGDGITATIYRSGYQLKEEQKLRLQSFLSRKVSGDLLIKVPKPDYGDMGVVKNEDSLQSDLRNSNLEWVRPLAVASALVKDRQTGKNVLLMEFAHGIDLDDGETGKRITEEDANRIVFQTLMVAHFMRSNNGVTGDFGKETRYLADENPPRVLVFDLASPENYPLSGKERAKALIKDQRKFFNNLKSFLIGRFDLPVQQKIIGALGRLGDFKLHSYMQVAQALDRQYDGRLMRELLAIEKKSILPADPTYRNLMSEEISLAENELLMEEEEKRKKHQAQEAIEIPLLKLLGIETFSFSEKSELGNMIKALPGALLPGSDGSVSLYRLVARIITMDTPRLVKKDFTRDEYKERMLNRESTKRLKESVDGQVLVDLLLDQLEIGGYLKK